MGHAYLELGNLSRAVDVLQQALDLGRKISHPRTQGLALSNLGDAYAKRGDTAKAIEHFLQALKIGEEINHSDILWPASRGIARAFEKQRNFDRALAYYKQAVNGVEKIRDQLTSDEHRSGFLKDQLETYEDLVTLLLRLHSLAPDKGYDREAFSYIERSRARALLDALAE